jgi:hypothetical protein
MTWMSCCQSHLGTLSINADRSTHPIYSSSPVLPAHETPVTPERLDSTQAIEKPKVTANHVFNPVVHQSVFHQINLWTRVREQLTPHMSDIPSALVIEAFIYNKTRRTFNFK